MSQGQTRKMVMVRIPAGEFLMGSAPGHGDRDEFPEHRVRVDEFLMARHLVTAAEFAGFLNQTHDDLSAYFTPSTDTTIIQSGVRFYPRTGCAHHPANGVTFHGAVAYCRWLAEKTGKAYRLPTEAEWEKACRGGLEKKRYPWGNETPAGRAQYEQTWSGPRLTLSHVGSYPPNRYGLFDMVGNLWEWCSDWYAADYYHHSPEHNPPGPECGALKTLRGGSWGGLDVQIRCGIRVGEFPDVSDSGVGFRLVRSI
jgi:formylglycine-generating enzyme required for sulfatase activity